MGYSVSLARGDVAIERSRFDDALRTIRKLDTRDDLKGAWTRVTNPDGTFGRQPHWSFTDPSEIQSATSLEEMLAAFRYRAMSTPEEGVFEVELIGGTRSMGDDLHLGRALAPYVTAGSQLIWLGEDDILQRWSFDGTAVIVSAGRMLFSD